MEHSRAITITFVLIAAAGFLLPLWPLSAISIVMAALLRLPYLSLGIAVLCDVVWGVPPGMLEPLIFPFTLLGLMSILARLFADQYFFSKTPPLKLY